MGVDWSDENALALGWFMEVGMTVYINKHTVESNT